MLWCKTLSLQGLTAFLHTKCVEKKLLRRCSSMALQHSYSTPLSRESTANYQQPHPENKRAIRCYERVGFVYYATEMTDNGGTEYMMRFDCRHRAS